MPQQQEETFFDFAASVGLTKHIGGTAATDDLAALCHIGAGQVVLDVGCGVGVTPCYLVKRYGCQVVGVDIRPAMIARSHERARKEGLAGQTSFWTADAQALPFADAQFDAVITESVTAFPADKARALSEYARVTKPGGYVGLNETTWLTLPVPDEVAAWAAQDIGATVQPQTAAEWQELLLQAGLRDLVVKIRPIDPLQETKGIIQRYGYGGQLAILFRALLLALRSPAYRRFLRNLRAQGVMPEDLDHYLGYGLFVGQKPGRSEQPLASQRLAHPAPVADD